MGHPVLIYTTARQRDDLYRRAFSADSGWRTRFDAEWTFLDLAMEKLCTHLDQNIWPDLRFSPARRSTAVAAEDVATDLAHMWDPMFTPSLLYAVLYKCATVVRAILSVQSWRNATFQVPLRPSSKSGRKEHIVDSPLTLLQLVVVACNPRDSDCPRICYPDDSVGCDGAWLTAVLRAKLVDPKATKCADDAEVVANLICQHMCALSKPPRRLGMPRTPRQEPFFLADGATWLEWVWMNAATTSATSVSADGKYETKDASKDEGKMSVASVSCAEVMVAALVKTIRGRGQLVPMDIRLAWEETILTQIAPVMPESLLWLAHTWRFDRLALEPWGNSSQTPFQWAVAREEFPAVTTWIALGPGFHQLHWPDPVSGVSTWDLATHFDTYDKLKHAVLRGCELYERALGRFVARLAASCNMATDSARLCAGYLAVLPV